MRNLLVCCAGALSAVVLLKWSVLEAARIPSPSMQPVLLGTAEGGVFDHVVIDRLRYLVGEPRRWDLVSFRAPLQARETFLKRLVGLPGEHLAIAGGNLHVVEGGDGKRRLRVLRRPADVVEAQWRNVHPGRSIARGEEGRLGVAFRGEPAAAWSDRSDHLVATLGAGGAASLQWVDADGGLVDRLWDGLPEPVSRAVRKAHARSSHAAEIVGDARVHVRLWFTDPATRLIIAIDVRRPQHPWWRCSLELEGGAAALVVRRDGEIAETSPRVPLRAGTGGQHVLTFAHVDDELIGCSDGREICRCDVAAFDLRDGCELPDTCGMGPAMPGPEQRADVRIELHGRGQVTIHGITIWRDQHWTRGPLPAGATLSVPQDHYLLLGDNPLQSEDGRGARTFAIGELGGRAVPADTPGCTIRRGYLQLAPGDGAPSQLENPVSFPQRGTLVFGDAFGNWVELRGDAHADGDTRFVLHYLDASGAVQEHDIVSLQPQFVARSDLLGRAIARYWPVPPFGPWRPGWLH